MSQTGHTKAREIPITGVWLRAIGDDVEVLVEIDGQWRKVINENRHGAISHICEPLGIIKAPVDDLSHPNGTRP